MWLYSPVNLTGNMSMIEKLELSLGLEPGTSRSSTRQTNPCAIKHPTFFGLKFMLFEPQNTRDIYILLSANVNSRS